MPDLNAQPAVRRRRSRSRRQSKRRRLRRITVAVVAGTVLATAVWIGVTAVRRKPIDSRPTTVSAEQSEWLKQAIDDSKPGSDALTKAAERPVYKYSVIPGGVYDGEELRRALVDPVVAAHYEFVDRAKIHAEIVPADRYVHVSYRKDGQIFWSTKKVLLRKGETILTDGTTQIRSRCGNCISEEAAAPTAANEPDVVEFDRLVESITPRAEAPRTAPGNVTADSTRAGLVGVADQSAVTSGPTPVRAPMPGAGGAMPFIGGGGGASDAPLVSARRSGNREPDDTLGPSTGDDSTPGNPQGPWQGPGPGAGTGVVEPDIRVPPLTESFPPGGNEPPKLDDLFPPGPVQPNGPSGPNDLGPTPENPPTPTGNEPANPTPVPEPGTFMLVGGGAAALLRRLRSRSRQA